MYHSDKPISTSDEDLLERTGFAKNLAQAIVNSKKQDTMCIGLIGSWGSGKTSIINMMLREIPKNDFVIVHFEPWNFTDENQLIVQFFRKLSAEFGKVGDVANELGTAFIEYSSWFSLWKVIPFYGSAMSTVGENVTKMAGELLKQDTDISAQKDRIVKLLEKQKKKTLIIIDDIDRLTGAQIRAVFQLVASVANFPNITYLLSFDQDIVVEALKQVQTGDGNDYLQKIVQIPLTVPALRRDQLNNILFNRLDKILEDYGEKSFHQFHWQWIFPNCIEPFLNNIRDVNRLCNLLEFKFASIYRDIDFADMVAITTIEVVNPPLFSWIASNIKLLSGKRTREEMFFAGINNTSMTQEKKKESIMDILQIIDSRSSQKEKEKYCNAILSLFDRYGTGISISDGQEESRKNNYISNPDKIDRYFQLDLSTISASQEEIEFILERADCHQIFQILTECESKEKLRDIFTEIKQRIEGVVEERKKHIAKAVLESYPIIDEKYESEFLGIKLSANCKMILELIMKSIVSENRYDFLNCILEESRESCISVVANFLYVQEYANNRLEGECTNPMRKILEAEELDALVDHLVNIVVEKKDSSWIFDEGNSRIILYLIEITLGEKNDYIPALFKNSDNMIKYLTQCVTVVNSHEKGYSFEDMQLKYFTKEELLSAIEVAIKKKTITKFTDKIQEIVAALLIWEERQKDLPFENAVYCSDAKKRASSW